MRPLNSSSRYYLVSPKLAHIVLAALSLSTFLHIFGLLYGICGVDNKDIDALPSRLPVEERIVALETVDSDRYGMHDDNDWASVIPPGHGFVRFESDDYYAVSMYHQMHCLNSFRKIFNGRNASRAEHDGMHAIHCLSYLRQMVLCAADTTLEPAFTARDKSGKLTKAVYGAGVMHRCRDWAQVREFVETNHEGWTDEEKTHVATEASAINAI